MTSASGDNARFAAIFKAEVARITGLNAPFLRALGVDDTRSTLDDRARHEVLTRMHVFDDGCLAIYRLVGSAGIRIGVALRSTFLFISNQRGRDDAVDGIRS